MSNIKMIALDLDGTTLTSEKIITPRTQKALRAAMEKGINVVIATGRVFAALPEEILNEEGIEYAVTSNGAVVTRLADNEDIYNNCIDVEAAERVIAELRKIPYMKEIFVGKKAYVEKEIYENLADWGMTGYSAHYILTTRLPYEGVLDLMEENKDKIENVNVNFTDMELKMKTWKEFDKIPGVTITSSLARNIEIGGATTSKANALAALAEKLGIKEDEIMACGDSHNDKKMLEMAGIAVAMGNADDEVKQVADFITEDCDHDGVAIAVEKFCLND